jgi:hypothetical protein
VGAGALSFEIDNREMERAMILSIRSVCAIVVALLSLSLGSCTSKSHVPVSGAFLQLSQTASAPESDCNAVLAKDTISTQTNETYKLAMLSEIDEERFNLMKNDAAASANIIVDAIPLGGNATYKDFTEALAREKSHVQYNVDSSYNTSLIEQKAPSGAIGAWLGCMLITKELVLHVDHTSDKQHAIVTIDTNMTAGDSADLKATVIGGKLSANTLVPPTMTGRASYSVIITRDRGSQFLKMVVNSSTPKTHAPRATAPLHYMWQPPPVKVALYCRAEDSNDKVVAIWDVSGGYNGGAVDRAECRYRVEGLARTVFNPHFYVGCLLNGRVVWAGKMNDDTTEALPPACLNEYYPE